MANVQFLENRYHMSNLQLRDVQSNILRPHYRKFSRFMFIRFESKVSPNAIKDWIGIVMKEFQITSGATGLKNYKKFKKGKSNQERIFNLFFSAKGFQKMGFKKTDDGLPKDTAFWDGMEKRGSLLNDPDKKRELMRCF